MQRSDGGGEYPRPSNEDIRLREAKRLAFLCSTEDPTKGPSGLDRVCELARRTFGVESAFVALMLEDENLVIAAARYPLGATPRAATLCTYTIARGATLVVTDWANDPHVAGDPRLRDLDFDFYAGEPLSLEPGVHVATLCLLDRHGKSMTDADLELLALLGQLASDQLQLAVDRAGARASEARAERTAAEAQLATSALYDSVTGLAGPCLLDARLRELLGHEGRGSRGALLVLDVDHFEAVNESRSYAFGDRVLRLLAEGLRDAVGSEALVARRGGNEFALLFADTDSTESLRRSVQSVVRVVGETSLDGERPVGLTAGMGVVMLRESKPDSALVLRCADIALRAAKSAGAGRVEYYSAELGAKIEARIALLDDVRRGAAAGEFVLHYQPICDPTGAGRGFEALMRWQHPKRGLLAPYHFLVAFDDPELSTVLGDVALRESVRQMRAWSDAALDYGYVSVNLATEQFAEGNLAERVALLLSAHRVPPQRLMLEVTERVYLDEGTDLVGEALRQLRAIGVSFALDDFGTGYASLTHLKQFPIDRIKIDRSFVNGMCDNQGDSAIVRAIISLGQNLGIQLVAEGVETAVQLAFLRAAGCEQMQGYFFAKPMPADQAASFCKPLRP